MSATPGLLLVIGLGNPLLTDDAVGPEVLRHVQASLGSQSHVHCKQLGVGGLRLMEEMLGYRKVFLADAMVTGQHPPGTVRHLVLDDLGSTHNLTCMHDMGLPMALEVGRQLGMPLPDEIRVWGIEAHDVQTFAERPTETVARAAAIVAREILEAIAESK